MTFLHYQGMNNDDDDEDDEVVDEDDNDWGIIQMKNVCKKCFIVENVYTFHVRVQNHVFSVECCD